ncbi:aminopeptidase N-like isoform X2 [Homarus americanus]|nr:aminopeptidase N-like isoform X2 [Homarus americanus]XP_042215804.1 aminopeptidase N-like isoform X2 [Homarus americanus]XP_042215806.1 aminopeptidase N-like isoform X2 [Homarus americanus]
MTNYNRNSDVVAMDINSPAHMVSFGKKSGCFISKTVGWLLAIFFVSALVATGLLVYFYAPHHRIMEAPVTDTERLEIFRNAPNIATTKTPTTTTIITTKAPTTTTTTSTTTTSRPTTTTEAPKEEKINVRLPNTLKPLHYLVKLQPLINGNFSILGYVEVEMEVLEPTSNVTLHMADIITKNETIKLRDLNNLEGPELVIKKHEYDREREFYLAHLEEELQQGHKYILSMEFTGLLNDKMAGFYRSSYRNAEGNKTWLAATQFQPTSARRAFPCFDEPGLKATFEVYLARQENMTSISNMLINETLPVEGQEGWVWDHYDTTVPMSTYLVAFVVSDFAYRNATDIDHVLFRVWAREAALDQTEYSRKIGPAILTHYEDYFNQSYPLPKQDMIAIPDFSAGAMENWGLITYRETAMLYDPAVSAPVNQYRVALVVAHELAHQWFGNIVTPTWWTDLWLNEGFASFVQYIGMDHVEPSWKVHEQFILDKVQNVFSEDSLESSHEISIPVGHPNEISQIFDGISYNKGSSIIRMMNHFLTEATFRKGVSDYLDAFQYDTAEQDDLWRHLTTAAHQDDTLPQDLTVKTIMDTWTLQMGYPVIKVERSPDGTTATVSQERFLTVKKNDSEDTHDYKWWVPLTYTGGDDPNFNETRAKVWMKDSETHITIPSLPTKDQWVIFNLQETGYYRVNYDQDNWNLLIQQLLTDHRVINTINRAQIIDDAMDLARAGQISYDVALGLYSYLGNEVEYVPWKAAVNNLAYLRNMFYRTGSYGALKNYLLDMVVQLYDSVGFDNSLDDLLLEQYKRNTAVDWACKLGHKPCLDNVLNLYRQWMLNPHNETIISPNLKSVVYCRAMAAGGEEEWEFAWDRYLKSNVGSEKSRLLRAMGCTNKLWLLSRFLEIAFNTESGIRKQDSQLVFSSVAFNPIGRPLALTYLNNHWKKIYDYFGGKAKSHLINSAMSNFNTEQQLKEVMDFEKKHRDDLDAASRKVQQIIERTKNNMAWMDANYQTIVNWLEQKGYSSKLRSVWVEPQP